MQHQDMVKPADGVIEKAVQQTESFLAYPNLVIDQEKGRIALLLPLDAITNNEVLDKLTLDGYTPKPEFHVTALDIKQGSELYEVLDTLENTTRKELFVMLEMAQNESWEINLKPEFYVIEKNYPEEDCPRRSVIQMVDCPSLDDFYEQINRLLPEGHKIQKRPAHITLATQGNPRGIGLNTSEELKEFGKPLDVKSF